MDANDGGIEILLIEGDPHEAELILESLHSYHLTNKLIHIDNGSEALDFIFAREKYSDRNIEAPPSIIILDVELPGVDGIEVLRRIKSDERTSSIPIVILTSSQEEKDIVAGHKYNVNSYVVKPLEFDKFTKVISDIGLYWLLINEQPSQSY